MASKVKGSRTERELVHLFNKTGDWSAIRVAGSGLTKDPNRDVLAGNIKRHLAIECKSIKTTSKYLYPEEIEQITSFASRFGAEPWVGARFDNNPWFFIQIENLKQSKTGNNFVVDLKYAKSKGITFDELIGKYKQQKLE